MTVHRCLFSRVVTNICVALALCLLASAQHNALLPRPQQVRYGTGRLALADVMIRIANAPAPEDMFAARQLAAALSQRAGREIPIQSQRQQHEIALVRTGPVAPLAVPGDRPGPGSREEYAISITPGGATVTASSSAGVFYGVQTLRQLVEGNGTSAALPEVEIHDWPALAYRGTMVDMSHGPLPTEQEVERQIDFLARWKANQYFLYSEASIELRGYPIINPDARFSQDSIRRIVRYARERHIDVIPNFDLYGHMHDLFRLEKYSTLSDLPHGIEFDPRKPEVDALLADWIGQFAALFPSPFVNIGFDETFQIETTGASPVQLFLKQIGFVTRQFQQRGKHVLAWEDIMVRFPQIVSQLPPGLIAVAWYYDAQPDPQYKKWLDPLVQQHVAHVVQSGVTSWNQVSPDFDKTFENIDTFLAAGKRSGALGLINSIWTDDAQMLMRPSWPGFAYGAAAPWQSQPMDRAHFYSDYANLMYPPKVAGEVGGALANLAAAETRLQVVFGDETQIQLWGDPFFAPTFEKARTHSEDLRQVRLRAEDAQASLQQALADGGDPATLTSLLFSSRMLDYAGQKFQTPTDLTQLWQRLGPTRPEDQRWWNEWESQATYQDHSHIVDLMDGITGLKDQYRTEWLAEYTPYRLLSALGRWDAEYEYWRRAQQRLLEFSETTRRGDPLPPLPSIFRTSPSHPPAR